MELTGPPPASRLDHAMCIVTFTFPRDLPPKETDPQRGDCALPGIIDITKDAMFVVDGVKQDLSNDDEQGVGAAAGTDHHLGASDAQTLASPDGNKPLHPEAATAVSSLDNVDVASCVFVHGGMDVSGQIFDDCLVIKLDDL